MAPKLFSAALVAAATLAAYGSSCSSFAEVPIPGLPDQVSASSGMKTREDVRAELVQAQRQGYALSSTNAFPPAAAAPASQLTRAEVKADVMASHHAASGTDVDYGYAPVH